MNSNAAATTIIRHIPPMGEPVWVENVKQISPNARYAFPVGGYSHVFGLNGFSDSAASTPEPT